VVVALALLVGFAVCGNADRVNVKVYVLVAASSKEATETAVNAYLDQLKQNEKPQIIVVSGASSSLAQQIIAGVPADIFISANSKWSEAVADQSRSIDSFLTNRLVLATYPRNAHITSVDDLVQPEVRCIAVGGDSVPIGQYASQAIANLPSKQRQAIESKLVFGKDSSALLAWLENNEADAGFVYASDLNRSSNLIAVQQIDSGLHDPILYSIVSLAGDDSEIEDAADQLLLWLQSGKALAIYRDAGFGSPE